MKSINCRKIERSGEQGDGTGSGLPRCPICKSIPHRIKIDMAKQIGICQRCGQKFGFSPT